jgi:Bacterial Ig-like domain (group 2)
MKYLKYVALVLVACSVGLAYLHVLAERPYSPPVPPQNFRILARLLEPGDRLQLLAIGPERPGLKRQPEIRWRSANEKIATVDANGLVTGVAAGRTTIFATCDDCPVELKDAEFPVQIGRYVRLVPIPPTHESP